jgi:glycerol-3-phosphate dehydrogenase
MPITNSVYNIIYNKKDAKKEMEKLQDYLSW